MATYIKHDVMHLNNLSIEQYRQLKIRILQDDFHINLTPAQLTQFGTLHTDRAIERYFFSILDQRFNGI